MGRLGITIEDITGNKEQQASVPDDVAVGQLLEKLTAMLKLPITGPDNERMSYRMIHKASGNGLEHGQTLAEAGVKQDDHLRIQPEITAENASQNEGNDFVIELGESRTPEAFGSGISIIPTLQVQQQMLEFASSDLENEVAGILIGLPEASADGTKLMITAMLKAKKTVATDSSVTFTHESWEQIHREKEILYPELAIVGWFHTHLGSGTELSGKDRFIQKHFFDLPWQVVFVIDPISEQQAFYAWHENDLVTVPWILLNNGQLITSYQGVKGKATLETDPSTADPEVPPPLYDEPDARQHSAGTKMHWMIVALVLALLLIFTNLHRLSSPEEVAEVSEALPVSVEEDRTEELEAAVILQEQQIEALENDNRQLEALVDELRQDRFIIHTVAQGDTLWSVSSEYYGDPTQYLILMQMNEIQNPDNLEIGRRLLIPKSDD